jgi:transketolase
MKQKSTRDAYGDTLKKIGENKDIVVLDADLSVSTKTSLFAKQFPERFIDVGCAEQNLIGTASGLALCGKTVFASTYAIFVLRALEQIRNTVAHDKLNVKITVTHAGLTNSVDGASHQALEDIAFMRAIPNIRVIVPADAIETEKAIIAEINQPGPAYIRLNRSESPVIFDEQYEYDPNRAEILKDGHDIVFFATGTMVPVALDAADLMKKESVNAAVIDVHTIKPLDTTTVAKIAKQCGCAVTIEEHSITGGLGGAIAECTSEYYPVPIKFIGVNNMFGQSGEYNELLKVYGLTTKNIINSAHKLMKVNG